MENKIKDMKKRILQMVAFIIGVVGSPIFTALWVFSGKHYTEYFLNFATGGDFKPI